LARGGGLEDIAELITRFLPIFEESRQPAVGQGVMEQLLEDFTRHGANVIRRV